MGKRQHRREGGQILPALYNSVISEDMDLKFGMLNPIRPRLLGPVRVCGGGVFSTTPS